MKENVFGTLIIISIVWLIVWDIYLPKKIYNDVSGTWKSNTEEKYTVTFDSFGNVVEGFDHNTTSGLYEIVREPINKFMLKTEFEIEFQYIINDVNKNKLVLTDLETGEIYSFSRVN